MATKISDTASKYHLRVREDYSEVPQNLKGHSLCTVHPEARAASPLLSPNASAWPWEPQMCLPNLWDPIC